MKIYRDKQGTKTNYPYNAPQNFFYPQNSTNENNQNNMDLINDNEKIENTNICSFPCCVSAVFALIFIGLIIFLLKYSLHPSKLIK